MTQKGRISPSDGENAALIPAIGYVRVSTAREEMLSPEIQRARVAAEAERAGRRITDWIVDLDASGRNFRRKIMAGIARIEAGEAAEIWTYRYNRWGRNAAESLANIRRVELAGGSVVSATEPFDAETAIGKYTRTNALALAEMESDIIGDNWRDAHASRRGRGMPVNGTPRFGYVRKGKVPDPERAHVFRRDPSDPDGERYEPDPVTGPVLAELYLRFTAGTGTTRLLKWLAGQGVTTTRGAAFSANALLRVLDSGFGAGLLRVHDPACGCRDPGHCRRCAWIPGRHPAVISGAQWQAYRQARQDRARTPPRSRDPAYPLSGLVKCGTCGGPCTAAHSNGQRGYGYRCANWVQHRGCPGVFARRADAEAAVLARLAEWADDLAARAAARKSRARVAARSGQAAERHRAEVAKADRELKRLLLRDARDEGIPPAVWESAKAELLAARATAEEALAAASSARELNEGDFTPVVRGLLEEWDLLSPGARRHMLSQVIRVVRLTRTGVRKPAEIRVIAVWEND